ncbi:dual specificity protein phosphatase 3 [Orussus abietinus]|uniref:dual specificity protein phosphatase 3 n=1 Tax=Orussus abietinus TaxID=222816 RepID=UPI0006262FAA|nr:dual specificity protein phosphatase 3 [Orussus abietinus]
MNNTWRDRDRDFQKHLPGGETTGSQLHDVLSKTETELRPIPGFDENVDDRNYYRLQHDIDCDEVYPNIILGDASTAKNKKFLKRLGVTHVLNTAEGNRFGLVNTNRHYYSDTSIEYLGLPIIDLPTIDISQYFPAAVSFIHNALSSGGKVFVHCMLGISRSATCVIAYLMTKKEMLAVDAIQLVRTNRCINPNQGFLRQLANLDNRLRRERLNKALQSTL